MCMWLIGLAVLAGLVPAPPADAPLFDRQSDVIYGRKAGLALTMDVFLPRENANGAAVVLVVSGGFFSSNTAINPAFCVPLVRRGYTVFCVVHGSQPTFTVDQIVPDIHRAVRFIRHHAERWKIDPQRIGIGGGSAGGHLSLMLGVGGGPGPADAADPVDRASSAVQAVACFFPPTDFLNFGEDGRELLGPFPHAPQFRPAFDHHQLNRAQNVFDRVTDSDELRKLARAISPIYFVSSKSAPTFIIHGDRDTVVPIQQARTFVAKLKEAGVPAELSERPGAAHGWPTILLDVDKLADWFDQHLGRPATPPPEHCH
ncbi:MAG TPA: prolyl oligopeptidase family serine peptidase [Gemmatales bacterium]|nr:prolyl oligopeptidase family serine peptidase [Gemmatales bacterium]HMP58693.1 prolyl oligopeptidase family serine peptidase [Gemmatales bacterium]